MMEALITYETLADLYQSTRRYNPQDGHLHTHRRKDTNPIFNVAAIDISAVNMQTSCVFQFAHGRTLAVSWDSVTYAVHLLANCVLQLQSLGYSALRPCYRRDVILAASYLRHRYRCLHPRTHVSDVGDAHCRLFHDFSQNYSYHRTWGSTLTFLSFEELRVCLVKATKFCFTFSFFSR
jgi:hypothetical protein